MSATCSETNLKVEKYHIDFVVIFIAFYIITSITATLLNVLVILTICKTPSLQTPSRILLCSLALTDLFVGVLVEPAYIAACILALLKWCSVFDTVYHFASRLGYALGAISMITLAAISVDRFLAIRTKQNYKLVVTKRRIVLFLIFLWAVPGTAVFLIRYFKSDDSNDTKWVLMVVAVLLLAITVFYSMSFYYLKKVSSSQVTNHQPPAQQLQQQQTPGFNIWKYKRSLVTMVMILGIILGSYLPLSFLLSTRTLDELLDDPALLHLCEAFVILNSTINPILYLWRIKSLRQALKNILFKF